MQRLSYFSTKIWLLILLISIAMESGALFYQHVLDYGPCILCVQIRAVVLLIILISLAGLFSGPRSSINKLAAFLLAPLSVFFGYQTYQVLGIERGWFEGSCTMDAAFPDWIPLHEWLPSVFEPWELCGYTPYIVGKITMAEVLVAIAALFFVANLTLIIKGDSA